MKINITKTQRARLVKDWLNDMFSDADLINSYYVKNGKKLAYQNKKIKGVWFDYNTLWSFFNCRSVKRYCSFTLHRNDKRTLHTNW